MFAGDRRQKTLTLGAMCFALFMVMLDNTVVNVALPKIQRDLGSGVSGLQWIVDAYTLLFASFMLSGGTIGDIFGRRRTFQVGLAVFTLGSLLCGVAPNIATLVAARGLQGVGAAALLPGTLSILTNTFPDPTERAQAIGLWAGVSGLALAMGPVLGGLMVDSLGWQSVFFLNVPVGIVALVVSARFVRESKNPEGRRLDLPGQALAVVALGSLTYALIEGNAEGWRSPIIISLLVVAAVALAGFLLVETRSDSPMMQLEFFRNATFTAANTVAFVVSFGMFGMFFFLSLYMQNVHGYSAVEAGLRFLPQTGAIIVTAPLAGRLAGRLGSRLPMAIGLALAGSALLLMTRADVHTAYGSLWWVFTMAGVGMGLTMTPMTAAVMGTVPPARAGMASATTNTSREVGGVFGIALLGAIVTARTNAALAAKLAASGLPVDVQHKVAAAVSGGAAGSGAVTQLGTDVRNAVVPAINESFVAGMHVALVVAGISLLAGALLAVTFVQRPARRPVDAAAGDLQPDPALDGVDVAIAPAH